MSVLLMLIVWAVAVTGIAIEQKIKAPILIVLALVALLVVLGIFPAGPLSR